MRIAKVLSVLLVLLCLNACERTVNNPVTPPAPAELVSVPPEYVGHWLLESGSMMPDFVMGLATYSVTADVTAIRIGDDGTGNIWLRDRLTDAKDCVRAYVLLDDDDHTLVFDFAAETVSDVEFNLALERYRYLFPVSSVDANSLGIADEEGRIALFSRQATLPADVDCAQLQLITRYDGVPAPQYFTDIALWQGDLVYSTSTQIERFVLATHSIGTPLGATSSRLVQTAQGSYLWTHCGCGGSRDAFKRTLSLVVDTVSSETEMGGAITFRAMVYNPSTDRLWLHGRPFDSQFGQFYVVDTSGEPDIVEQTISFNRDIRGLAYDGTDLWGIVTVATQTVVRIDPSTGKAKESYEVPDQDVSWAGLEIAPDGMYMLGTDAAGDGVIVHLMIPMAPTSASLAANVAE